jgi:predicted permease
MRSIVQDLWYAFRQLRKSPGFAIAVIGVLALGIGANAAMFTILNGTLLRRLPYKSPDRLVSLSVLNDKDNPVPAHLADILEWQQKSRTLDGIAYYNTGVAYVRSGGSDQSVSSISISPNLFDVLGTAPASGRGFTAEEQQPGKDNVVVLSDAVWRGQFHAADVLGKVVRIDDVPVTVIGIMPSGFYFPANDKQAQVWKPSTLTATAMQVTMESPSYQIIARLRGAVSIATVQQELKQMEQQMRPLYAAARMSFFTPAQVQGVDYRQTLVKNQRTALMALLAAVAVVWLIACANVANLMLARASARRREMAVRRALGASRWRLVRQLMVESLLLSGSGALLGIALAQGTLHLFQHTLTTELASTLATRPDARVLAALLVLSILSALLFGLVPALIAARIPIDQTLRQDGAQTVSGRSQQSLQRILVVAEVGLSLMLLVSCGLLLRTVFALRHVPLGFRTDHVYVVQPKLPGYKYRTADANQTVYKPLLERVKRMHGVEAAELTTVVPLDRGFNMEMTLYGADKKSAQAITSTMKASGPGLQKVLGFRMAEGRYFNAQDTPETPLVAVVNRAFANLYRQNGESLDKFSLGSAKGRHFKIVGVIDDFHQSGIGEPAMPEIDLNAAQMRPDDPFYAVTLQLYVDLAIRATTDERNLMPDLLRVMREVNPDLSASTIKTMDQVVEDSMGSQLLAAHLLETLGLLALVMALAGLYSLLAYLVTLRTRELGLRMALGAERRNILKLVMQQAGWLLACGILAGIVASLATTQLLKHFLFGVSARDLTTIVAATLMMTIVGALAAYLPARRASRIEPMEALRTE